MNNSDFHNMEGCSVPPPSYQPSIVGRRYMASTGHYLATEAAIDILSAGGNAIDAGVAACITLSVVQSDQVQFGGVAPIMIFLAKTEEVLTISGLGWWPKATSLEYFLKACGGNIPRGVRRTVVPAAPDAYIKALSLYGTMTFGEVSAHAIRCASEGIALHRHMQIYIERHAQHTKDWPGNLKTFFPQNKIPQVGDLITQQDLANVLIYMKEEEHTASKKGRKEGLMAARQAFYRGDIARTIVAFQREHDGWLTEEDLLEYNSEIETAISHKFHDIDIHSCGPWCQGPVLLQMLSLLEKIDLRSLGHNTAEYIHVVAEALKLAFSDREQYYGDPRFVTVPVQRLLSAQYVTQRSQLIDPNTASPVMPRAGTIMDDSYNFENGKPSAFTSDTSYAAVIDSKGNVFSGTPSDTSWDSPIIPNLGFSPSSRGSQSFAVKGHPSSVAPGKRPRLTPNPAIAKKGREWIMPFGASGGDTQPQGMLQVLLNHVIFGMDIQTAIDSPRLCTHSQPNSFEPHLAYPGVLALEGRIKKATGRRLSQLGHTVTWLPDISIGVSGVSAISADLLNGTLTGAADPRRPARAMGW